LIASDLSEGLEALKNALGYYLSIIS